MLKFIVMQALILWPSFLVAETSLTVAVSANFAPLMKQLRNDFESKYDFNVELVQGASGKLFAQAQHGAPFSLFFSADQEKPKELIDLGLAYADSRFCYAEGRLVLWSPDEKRFNTQHYDSDQFKELLIELSNSRIAIANPRFAPYGRAAMEVIESITPEKMSIIRGESVAQAYQFVATRNADVGLLALSQILLADIEKRGSMVRVPESLYTPIKQERVILKTVNENSAAVQAFTKYMNSSAAQAFIEKYGYRRCNEENINTIALTVSG